MFESQYLRCTLSDDHAGSHGVAGCHAWHDRSIGCNGSFSLHATSEENCTLILVGSIGSQVDGAFGGRNRILARIGKTGIPTEKNGFGAPGKGGRAAFAF